MLRKIRVGVITFFWNMKALPEEKNWREGEGGKRIKNGIGQSSRIPTLP